MKTHFKIYGFTLFFLAIAKFAYAEPEGTLVQVQVAPGKNWTNYPTRTLAALPESVTSQVDTGLDQYGGLLARKETATGFFYPKKIGDRWGLVDPEGGLFLHKAVVAVSQMSGPGAMAAFKDKYGTVSNGVAGTTSLLHSNGFNGLGAWSDTQRLRRAAQPLVYTRIWDFMSNY